MHSIDQSYKRKFTIRILGVSSTFVLEIVALVFLLSRDLGLFLTSDISKATLGAIVGLFAVISAALTVWIITQYRTSIEFKYENLLRKTDLKFQILSTEYAKQRAELLSQLESKNNRSTVEEYLKELDLEEMYLQRQKLDELRKALSHDVDLTLMDWQEDESIPHPIYDSKLKTELRDVVSKIKENKS